MRQEKYRGWVIKECSEHPAILLVVDPDKQETNYHYNDLDTFEEAVTRMKNYIDLLNGDIHTSSAPRPLLWLLTPLAWLIALPSTIHRWKYRR